MEESELIAKSKSGRGEFFGQLYDLYIKKIYDFLYYRTHHKQTAEDLASAVFTKAWEKIRQYDASKAKFSTWLYRIAKNTLTDHFRAFKSAQAIEDIWDLPSAVNIERDVGEVLTLEKVKAQIQQLPALQRDIMIMRLWDGLSHREIAEILDISEGNSKVAFSRAVEKLKISMGTAGLLSLIILSSTFPGYPAGRCLDLLNL